MEELDANMEDNEGAEEEKEEVNLGKLQFSLDYDFQKNEVIGAENALESERNKSSLRAAW